MSTPKNPNELRKALQEAGRSNTAFISTLNTFLREVEMTEVNAQAVIAHLPEAIERMKEGKGFDMFSASYLIFRSITLIPSMLHVPPAVAAGFADEMVTNIHGLMYRAPERALRNAREMALDLGDPVLAARYDEQLQGRVGPAENFTCMCCNKTREKDMRYAYRLGDTWKAAEVWDEIRAVEPPDCGWYDAAPGQRPYSHLYVLEGLGKWEDLIWQARGLDVEHAINDHMLYGFLIRARQWDRAIRVLEQSWEPVMNHALAFDRWTFLLDTRLLLLGLEGKGLPTQPLVLDLPLPSKPVAQVEALFTLVENHLNDLARAFDTRNGNDWHTRLLRQEREMTTFFPDGLWEQLLKGDSNGSSRSDSLSSPPEDWDAFDSFKEDWDTDDDFEEDWDTDDDFVWEG